MFMTECIKKLLVSLIIFTTLASFVYSLGISPAKIYVDFYPGLTTNLTFNIINNVGYDTYVAPTIIAGELEPYITSIQKESILIPNGGTVSLTFQLKFPQEIEFAGTRFIEVGAVESGTPSESGGGIIAKTGVLGRIVLFIPYPGKYLEYSFSGEDIAQNQTVHFTVQFQNKGKQRLNTVTGNIDIYDKDSKIATLNVPSSTNLDVYDSREIIMNWSSVGQPVGIYKASLTLNFDGNIRQRNITFHIGEESVEILNFTRELEAEKISKFVIDVQSVWNSQLANVWAWVNITDGKNVVQEMKTPVTELSPWEQKELVAYFDGKGVAIGDYDAEIAVYYNQKVSGTRGTITVIAPKPEEKPQIIETAKPSAGLLTQTNIFLGITILAIILLIINILVTLRKKK